MFLERILEKQRAEVAKRKTEQTLGRLFGELDRHAPPIRPFGPALAGENVRLIAEVKKASPSKGLLRPDFHPETLGKCYEQAGAAAISVLTEEQFFMGSLDDLGRVKRVTTAAPVLRKDFIIDPYQLVEARVWGADAVLLIVAALTPGQLPKLLEETARLGMDALVETHDGEELKIAVEGGADIIGINNRNLKNFQVDLQTSYRLAPRIPSGIVKISESGITAREDLLLLSEVGVNAVLVGETLVTRKDPAAKIRELLGETI